MFRGKKKIGKNEKCALATHFTVHLISSKEASVQASVKAMHQRFIMPYHTIRKNATLNRTRQFKKDDGSTAAWHAHVPR